MNTALHLIAERDRAHPLLFIGLGEKKAHEEQMGNATLRFLPHTRNPEDVASYFQAADVYIHAAAADTFPRLILEALGCGTPVVATNVGGIPEQIRSLWDCSSSERATGIVVPPRDAPAMAFAIETLLQEDRLSLRLSQNAARDALDRFDLIKQADCYMDWYQQLVRNRDRMPLRSF